MLIECVTCAHGTQSLPVHTLVVTITDRKSTRLNSSHSQISYAVFCLKKKTDSVTRLRDRQPPHHLFMELARTYSTSSGNRPALLSAGLPGEPALGPTASVHRFPGTSR